MTTVSKSTASTIVSLLGTIGAAASMVAKTVDSASSSVDMLDAYVQRAKSHQAVTHKIEDASWLSSLKEDAAIERIKRHKTIAATLTTTQDRTLFDQYLAEFDALFAEPTP